MPPGRHALTATLCRAIALACALFSLGACRLRAEDIVTLRPQPGQRTGRKISGQIIDYTGRALHIRSAGGPQQSIRPEWIDRIETNRTPQHNDGDGLFARGDFRQAEAKYRDALGADGERRPWMQRQILAQLVWCYRNTGQWEQAGEVFLMLVERDPDSPNFDCIPLAWTAAQPSRALETKSLAWLAVTDKPLAVLLGASHLLSTNQRAAALEALRKLVQDRDARVAWLAQTQIWRTGAAGATPNDLAGWMRFIEEGDQGLRAGPYFVLGGALVPHDPERAALTLLEVPILYPRHRQLAAAALLSAGGCLERTGHTTQSAGLYRELLDEYGEAAETGEAQRRLDQLARGAVR